jgi:hypothetical protein
MTRRQLSTGKDPRHAAMSRHAHRSAAILGVAAALLIGLNPAAARAVPVIEFSNMLLIASSEAVSQAGGSQEALDRKVGFGSGTAETLLTGLGGRFFTRTTGPLRPFASAEVNSDFNYGVGASGLFLAFGEHTLVAETLTMFSAQNTGTSAATITMGSTIPEIQVLLAGRTWAAGQNVAGSAFAATGAAITRVAADGTRSFDPLFEYSIFLATANHPCFGFPSNLPCPFSSEIIESLPATSRYLHEFSPDLAALEAAGLVQIEQVNIPAGVVGFQPVFGFTVPAFTVFIDVPIAPGEEVIFELDAVATLSAIAEEGGQAQIGDPFGPADRISVSFAFEDAPEPGGPGPGPGFSVPQPRSLFLLALGLIGLGPAAIRSRRAGRRTATEGTVR